MTDTADITVLALTPEQMRPAQDALIRWVGDKIRAINAEIDEQGRALEEAARTPFTNQRNQWTRELNKSKRLLTFYEKVQEALEAGYIIVPDFPIDVFAIRTKASTPSGSKTFSDRYDRGGHMFEQSAQALPSGAGQTVSPDPLVRYHDIETVDASGRPIKSRNYWADEFREVSLPARLVRPEILDATNKALTRKLFDELGLVGQPKRDPIIIGRIIDPREPRHRRVSFFVAWWLDTRSL